MSEGNGRVLHPFQEQVAPRAYHGAGNDRIKEAIRNAPIEVVKIADLTMIQRTVDPDIVDSYIDKPPGEARWQTPIVLRYEGRAYLFDGHHRAVAEWAKGETMLRARVATLEGDDE